MKNIKLLMAFLGIILMITSLIINGIQISLGSFPDDLFLFSAAIVALSVAYLTDHFSAKDERATKIRERAIYISYFWMLGFILILLTIVNPELSLISITAYQATSLLLNLYVCTVFIIMSYYARAL